MVNGFSVANWQEAFLVALSETFVNILTYIPTILAAFLVFIIGLVLAKWGKILTIKIFNAVQLNALVKKSGLDPFLKKAEVKLKIEEILGGVVKWLIILIFFIATINVLGLSTVSVVLNSILGYIPKVISAVLILTIGVLLAGVVESVVKGALGQVDVKTSRLLAKISSYVVVIFAILAAINELKIAQTLINTLFMGFVAMSSLGIGLALGLGAKDLVSKILNEWYDDFRKQIKK